jgi:hypothetical protein
MEFLAQSFSGIWDATCAQPLLIAACAVAGLFVSLRRPRG